MSGTASTPTIDIVVNTDGSTNVQTHGYSGNACRSAAALLKKALGAVTDKRMTSEFCQHAATAEREREASWRVLLTFSV